VCEEAHKESRRAFPNRKPGLRRHEKADLGQARIGAHVASFNFANSLIRAIASSRR